MGVACEKISNTEAAKEFFEKSLSISESIGDRSLTAKNYNDLGLCYIHEGQAKKVSIFLLVNNVHREENCVKLHFKFQFPLTIKMPKQRVCTGLGSPINQRITLKRRKTISSKA